MKKYHWQTCGLTDKGNVRKRNEDNLYFNEQQGIWLVADGAGGHANGHLASSAVVDAFQDYQATQRIGNDVRQVVSRLHEVNQLLIDEQEESGIVSGSTVSVIISDGRALVCIWSGDSPIYRFRNNKLMRVIQDHNRVEAFMQQGFSAEECEAIPYAQYLTQAVGANKSLCVQTQWCDMRAGDWFLIFSDGVTKELNDHRIETILREQSDSLSTKTMSHILLEETLASGARDNSTVVSLLIK